jgi:hypothetical protein
MKTMSNPIERADGILMGEGWACGTIRSIFLLRVARRQPQFRNLARTAII